MTFELEMAPLTRNEVSRLLSLDLMLPIGTHEKEHSWSVNRDEELGYPLLRIWDQKSGSQPDKDGRMLAREPRLPLETRKVRRELLASHLNNRKWGTSTPFISFQISSDAVAELARWRFVERQRGMQTLVVIDPDTRARLGYPTLDVAAEMNYYNIRNPYAANYNRGHYVCLWEVTPEEVVGQWDWADLSVNSDWYEDTIMPAYRQFRERKRSTTAAFDLSELGDHLPDILSPQPKDFPVQSSNKRVPVVFLPIEYSDDTDDEVEEANKSDDILNA